MKKILFGLFIILLCLTLSSCMLDKKREERRQELIKIQTVGNYGIYSGVEYRSKNFSLYYIEYIKELLKKDNVDVKEDYISWRTFVRENRIFYYYYFDSRDTDNDTILGYIDIINDEFVEEKHLYFNREFHNMDFYYYENNLCVLQLGTYNSKYIVYDTNENKIEQVNTKPEFVNKENNYTSEYTINDKTYVIEQDNHKVTILEQEKQIKLEIDADYIYERCDEYKQIHEIYGSYMKKTETKFIVCDSELFIYVKSAATLMGRGELEPVAFKYDIVKDEFEYIGCLLYQYDSDIVNIVEIK